MLADALRRQLFSGYLADADIRTRDEAYRERQSEVLEPIIEALEHGTIPRSDAV